MKEYVSEDGKKKSKRRKVCIRNRVTIFGLHNTVREIRSSFQYEIEMNEVVTTYTCINLKHNNKFRIRTRKKKSLCAISNMNAIGRYFLFFIRFVSFHFRNFEKKYLISGRYFI